MSRPLVSQHLRGLRPLRIVTAHRRSREVEYSLTGEHIARIVLDEIRHASED
ncbi:hypothetical protein ACPC54_25035 [Kitasatospora sp. NPDC094028]